MVTGNKRRIMPEKCVVIVLTVRQADEYSGINLFTLMSPTPAPNAKRLALQKTGTFNPRAEQVRHALFQASDFFDPQDLLQLKYETLRALQHNDYSIARAAAEFGLSRPTIYQAQAQLQQHGLEGLLPRKRGPKSPHKLTPAVAEFIGQCRTQEPELSPRELAARVRRRFRIQLHPRTIEKARHARVKGGRPPSP
jgi:transposase